MDDSGTSLHDLLDLIRQEREDRILDRIGEECYRYGLADDRKGAEHNVTIVRAVANIVGSELQLLASWARREHAEITGPVSAYHVAAVCHLTREIDSRVVQTRMGE